MKILSIIGTRPQLIKASILSPEIRRYFEEVIVDTGQHYDHSMAGIFYDELNIPRADYFLSLGNISSLVQIGKGLLELDKIIEKENPQAILVYGDTNSTLTGTIASVKKNIPLIHIEAGLRSYNKKMPEEINRIIADHIADYLFVPTLNAVNNLATENIHNGVFNVGDLMYDAVIKNLELAKKKVDFEKFGLKAKEYILMTVHRHENFSTYDKAIDIVNSILKVESTIILPLHLGTKEKLIKFGLFGLLEKKANIKIIEPVSYLEMLILQKNARTIVTDSGGIQKEAYFLKVPCLTLRDETEWNETVELGWNKLINVRNYNELNEYVKNIASGKPIFDVYGDGTTSKKIVNILRENLDAE